MPPKKEQQVNLEQKKAEKQAEAKANAEREREAAKTAQTAIEYKKKAEELGRAAAACGDPDERQKLLKQKLDKETRAETFGKTAKYIQTSGTFQGFAAGSGLGIGLGATLGTLVGTVVGGPTGLITGGIGAGIGKIHGPFINVTDWATDKLRSITGDLPGWKATAEQKRALEKMCGQVAETETPSAEELDHIAGDGGAEARAMVSSVKDTGSSWTNSASSMMPSWNSGEEKKADAGKQQKTTASKQQQETKSKLKDSGAASTQDQQKQIHKSKPSAQETTPDKNTTPNPRSGPRKLGKPSTAAKSNPASDVKKPKPDSNGHTTKRDSASPTNETKKKPRKLEPRSSGGTQGNNKTATPKAQGTDSPAKRRSPRKLESRS